MLSCIFFFKARLISYFYSSCPPPSPIPTNIPGVFMSLCLLWPEAGPLTTVQQRGQNHQSSARASSRKRTSRAIARMEPSDYGMSRGWSVRWNTWGLPFHPPPSDGRFEASIRAQHIVHQESDSAHHSRPHNTLSLADFQRDRLDSSW